MAAQVVSPPWMRCQAHGCPLFGPGGLRLLLPLLRPGDGEAGVEDAARIQRRRGGIEDRQRRDGGEGRRAELGGEQLADPAVGDAHHPDLVIPHPRLTGDRLDHVVAVEALKRLEEVERATRATGAAHVHVDDREPHQVREDGDAVRRSGRVRVPVARVLDQRRVRRREVGATRNGDARREAGLARGARRRVHVDGELRPVTGGEVRVAVVRNRLVVDARIPGRGLVRVHGERRGLPGHPRPGAPGSRVPGATFRNSSPPSELAFSVESVCPVGATSDI